MKGIRKGANLLLESKSSTSYILNLEDTHKGHYKVVFKEVPKKIGRRKKNYDEYFTWTTIKKFKSEARRLKMKVLKKKEVTEYFKNGI